MDLILTLSVSLAAALILGYVTQRIGLSPMVGYLLAGIVVGPNTPGFIADHHVAEQLAEIGIVLLMFGVGLHFDLKELLDLRRLALPGALGQSAVAAALGAVAAVMLGGARGWLGGIVYGLALSVASTVVMTRVLADHDELHTPAGHLAVGWTIVEDLLTVLILILLPAVVTGGSGTGPPLAISLGLAAAKIAALLVVLFVVGARVVPWMLKLVAATRSRELFTLTVLAVALGIAFGSSRLFGVSMALGAFLGGMVVGRSDFSLRAATEALPLRDAFAVLFFVSVGMLFDPKAVTEAPWLVAATVSVVILGKPLVSFLLARLLGQPTRASLSVGLALGQVGEFSFILGGMGVTLGLVSPLAMSALILAAIVSIALNPLLRGLVDPILHLARRAVSRPVVGRLEDAVDALPAEDPDSRRYRAVVIGYGPVGRTLVRLLSQHDVRCTVIEMNLQTVHRLRAQGIAAVYGDASHAETLRQAGVPEAGSLILSASGLASTEIIRLSRELAPEIRILVRSAYVRERDALREAGADQVFAGEAEVALAMHEAILREQGARGQKIVRAREKIRADLYREP
jgi:CPA2 family monovalent cation:H+ antiporter-2